MLCVYAHLYIYTYINEYILYIFYIHFIFFVYISIYIYVKDSVRKTNWTNLLYFGWGLSPFSVNIKHLHNSQFNLS